MKDGFFRSHRLRHVGIRGKQSQSLAVILLGTKSKQSADIFFKVDGRRQYTSFLKGLCNLRKISVPSFQHHELKAIRIYRVFIFDYHMIIKSICPTNDSTGRAQNPIWHNI